MSGWFTSAGDEVCGKQGVVSEVLCELPPKLTQRVAEVLQGRQAEVLVKQDVIHGDDLVTFPALYCGESQGSRQSRLLSLRAAANRLDGAFEVFSRDRDHEDFQYLWVKFLAPHSPQRLLAREPLPSALSSADSALATAAATYATDTDATPSAGAAQSSAIPTLLLSTNGASMADRLDLYGSFAVYLREHKDAYVALLRPEDLEAGVGGCFSSALAQFSGRPESAAEDIMGLVAWYEHETGRGGARTTAVAPEASGALAHTKTSAKTPSKTPGKGGRGTKTPGKCGRGGKTSGKAGRGGRGRGKPEDDEKENALEPGGGSAAAGEDAGGDGTVAARLRARRGAAGHAAAAAAETEAQVAQQAAAAVAARNRRRHVVLLVESAGRVTDRGALRALLAALYGERHRLPVVLVLGLSCPAAMYGSKLPADVAALLQLTAADLAPHPLQLHRLFKNVLLSQRAPASSLLLDGATMRELLVQSRLLEPSLATLQAALLEAHEQQFRREPLSPLALLPVRQHQADEAADAAAQRTVAASACQNGEGGGGGKGGCPKKEGRSKEPRGRRGGAAAAAEDSSSEDSAQGDDADSDTSSYVSVQSREEGGGEEEGGGARELDEAWLERRQRQHRDRLAAAVSELPAELVRAAAAAMGGNGVTAAGRQKKEQRAAEEAVCAAVSEAFGALAAWLLGLQWLTALAEGTGVLQQPGGQRYSLPSLYVAAASPRFWKPLSAAAAGVIGAAHTVGGSAAATSLGDALIAGVLGTAAAAAACSGGVVTGTAAGGGGRGALRALPEQELDALLDDLSEATEEVLRHGWMPPAAVQRAAKGLADLRRAMAEDGAAATKATAAGAGVTAPGEGDKPADGEGAAQQQQQPAEAPVALLADEDETSPVRRRLASQGLTSPPTAQKLQGITDRLGRLDPLPAPKMLQPNNAPAVPPHGPQQGAPQTFRKAGGAAFAAGCGGSVKLPSSGMTQTKRQRDKALLQAVQQRAAAGPALLAAGQDDAGASANVAAASAAERAAHFLAATLRELLRTCPFQLPGSAAFTFRDAPGLQRRLIGAPSLALHTALTQPELTLQDLQPGLHPDQEDAALAYQLLVGCRDGTDLRDWLADFCAASGLGRMQEVREEEDEERDEAGPEADQDGDRPMGRSRTSKRRHAPRKRKAAPKQEMVLSLDGPQAEAAVDALACRFEQAVKELEAVGLCRFNKRRKGLYVQRTYFPPEALA